MVSIYPYIIIKFSIASLTVDDMSIAVHSITIYDARLSGGSTVYQGTVEVLTYRGWLPVCNSYTYTWSNSRESKVLCQQLGYGVASKINI